MLQPARRKYRKEQKGRNKGISHERGTAVSFGEFGLKAIGRGRITARQIEAARRAMTRHIKRGGRIWIRIFPDKPISHKPAEVRMGNGKGNPEYYVAEIQPGKMLYEMDGVTEELAREAFRLAAAKLPLKTTVIVRQLGASGANDEGFRTSPERSGRAQQGAVRPVEGPIRPAHATRDPAAHEHEPAEEGSSRHRACAARPD